MRTFRRSALLGAALIALAAANASCETAARISSKVVAINLLLDIGDPMGVAPRQTEAIANVMSIEGAADDPEATALEGAAASLAIEDFPDSIQMTEDSPGVFRATSGSSATLVYLSGADYTISVVVPSGDFDGTYTTEVRAPARTEVTGLPDTQGGQMHPANAPLTLTLVGQFDRGLVVVVDSSGNVVYDNRPQDVQQALDFVFGDFDGDITIPGTVFSQPGSAYGIVISGLESAPTKDISPNLNIISRFYAGSAKTAIVLTQP